MQKILIAFIIVAVNFPNAVFAAEEYYLKNSDRNKFYYVYNDNKENERTKVFRFKWSSVDNKYLQMNMSVNKMEQKDGGFLISLDQECKLHWWMI